LLIGAFDEQTQLPVIYKRGAGMNISNDGDAKSLQVIRPVVDLNCLLIDDQTIGLNEEPPKLRTSNLRAGKAQQRREAAFATVADGLFPQCRVSA